MATSTQLPPAVRDLVKVLNVRTGPDGQYWLTKDGGRVSLIAPVVGGHLVWLRLIPAGAVDEAISLGLVAVGRRQPMPEYHHGRPGRAWHSGRLGQPISLTQKGGR